MVGWETQRIQRTQVGVAKRKASERVRHPWPSERKQLRESTEEPQASPSETAPQPFTEPRQLDFSRTLIAVTDTLPRLSQLCI